METNLPLKRRRVNEKIPLKAKKKEKKKEKRSYTITDAVRRKYTECGSLEQRRHDQVRNQLGMFFVSNHETVDSIREALEDCGRTTRHLVIPSCLIRAFDEDLFMAAVMSFLLYMERKLTKAEEYEEDSDWFVVKYPDIERFTGVRRQRIQKVMKDFRALGLIKTKKSGMPAMQHYRVDWDMLIQLCMERVLNYRDPLIDLGLVEVL
jgi:hypothetical protein